MPSLLRQMLRAARSLARALVVLLGVSFLAFAAVDLPPGDFLSDAALMPQVSRDTIDARRERFALDRPFPERYARWLASFLRGEGGYSLAYQAPVSTLLVRRAPFTLLLAGLALACSWTLALVLGIWSAARSRRWDGRAIAFAATAVMGVPDLLVALGLLLVAARTGLLPSGGLMEDPSVGAGAFGQAGALLRRVAMPAMALSLSLTPFLLRHVRTAVLGVLDAPFLLAQRARGVPERRWLWRGALRAASQPLVPLVGLSIAGAFSASMVVEAILSWPGLGPLFLEAVQARDSEVVLAGVMCSAALLVAGNLVGDLLLPLVDPRIEVDPS